MTTLEADPVLEAAAPPKPAGRSIADGTTVFVAVAAIAVSTVVRFVIAGRQPLWLDEAWTGAIASQHSLGDALNQAYWDANAPLYYLLAWAWAQVAGLSNEALRLPSALFGAAAPLLVALVRIPGMSKSTRLTWAALVALWIPGLWFSGDARCYTLLLLFSVGQALAFVRLLERPRLARAALWAGLSSLAILTHYYAAFVALAQGLAYLALARGAAVRTWPAALLFLPAGAWIVHHLPRLVAFARPDVAWYGRLDAGDLSYLMGYVVGSQPILMAVALVALAALVLGRLAPRPTETTGPLASRAVWAVAAAGAAAAVAMVLVGFVRPSFVDRYLIPCIPGTMLCLALGAAALARRWAFAPAAVVLSLFAFAVLWAWSQTLHGWRWYNFEVASDVLMKGHPQRLVFFWDHPAGPVEEPRQLDAVGGFFFRRAGHPVAVDPVVLKPGEEPNARLLAEAKLPRSAILWMYDLGVQGTAARAHRPNLAALDPSLACRNLGSGSIGILVCDRVMGGAKP